MRTIVIDGPAKINGTLSIQGSKNTMLVNLVLPILTNETCVINNVPRIRDVLLNLEILASLGAKVVWSGSHQVTVTCKDLHGDQIDPELALKTTSARFFIPLITLRLGQTITGTSLGDNIGADRGFSDFIKMLERFRIKHEKVGQKHRFYLDKETAAVEKLDLDYPSFSGTVGAVLASVLGKKRLVIRGVNQSPEIDNVLGMLRRMGAQISQRESQVEVTAVEKLHGTTYRNLSDHNALVTYAVAALITDSELAITDFTNTKLEAFWKFLNKINAQYSLDNDRVTLFPSLKQLRPVEIYAAPWPEFQTDWQPLAAPLLSAISGQSSIVDNVWSDRFGYWVELEKMGASGVLFKPAGTRFSDDKPHGLKIFGGTSLEGARVKAKDIRGGASLILAGMAAKGETIIENVEQIERGYEDIVGNLSKLGASIRYEE